MAYIYIVYIISLTLLHPSPPRPHYMFHVEKVNNPSQAAVCATDVCTAFNLREKAHYGNLISASNNFQGSEKMTDSFCSYEVAVPSYFNYELLNWRFCCYPSKNPLKKEPIWSSVTFKARQTLMGPAYSHFSTTENNALPFFGLKGGRRGEMKFS